MVSGEIMVSGGIMIVRTLGSQKALRITGTLAAAVVFLLGCKTTATYSSGVLYFRDGTYAECPGGIEFRERQMVCRTARGTLTVPQSDVARYELK
jgi:hypothetical protein